jgi:hypothetical protein
MHHAASRVEAAVAHHMAVLFILIYMHTNTYLHRSFVSFASSSSSSSSSCSALSSLSSSWSSGTSPSTFDDQQPKAHDPPRVEVVTQATADNSFAGYVMVRISFAGRRAKFTETGILGFVVMKATFSQAVCEVSVNPDVNSLDANDVFLVSAQTEKLTQVLSAASVTFVMEASGESLRYLHTWSCWQGLPTKINTQTFKIVPTPSVVVSFSIEGVNSVEDISKEVRVSIILSFSQAFGVPAESVYIEGLKPNSVRRVNQLPLGRANNKLAYTGQLMSSQRKYEGLSKDSLKNSTHIAKVLKADSILNVTIKQQQEHIAPTPMRPASLGGPKRLLLAVTITVKILTTSQSQAYSIAKAVTPILFAGLMSTLAQQGMKVEASSLKTVVVEPNYDKNPANNSQAVLDSGKGKTNTVNGSFNVAVVAGSTGAGFFLLLCILGFLVWSRSHKSVLQQRSAVEEFIDVNPFLCLEQPLDDSFLPEGTRPLFEQQQQSHQDRISTSGVPSTIVPDENDTICIDDVPFDDGTKKSSAAGSVFQPISASNSNIELR